jgi:hypothetical protein
VDNAVRFYLEKKPENPTLRSQNVHEQMMIRVSCKTEGQNAESIQSRLYGYCFRPGRSLPFAAAPRDDVLPALHFLPQSLLFLFSPRRIPKFLKKSYSGFLWFSDEPKRKYDERSYF